MTGASITVNPDALYESFDKNLYRITGSAQDDAIMQMMQANPDIDNSSNVQVSASDFGSGVDTSTTIQTTGSMQAGKKTYDNTVSGYILGVDPKVGIAKFYIGNTTSYLNWTGTTLIVKGSISATSIDIPDTSTTASFHVDSTGNAWWGATTLAGSTASVTAAGLATFAGITTINMKTYTDFETAARFISTASSGGTSSFGIQGCTLSASTTTTSAIQLRWWITNTSVFANSPIFTCSLFALALNSGSGSGAAVVALGNPTVSGAGYTFNDVHPAAGFYIQKSDSTISVYAFAQKGNSTNFFQSAALTTIIDNDNLELFMKITGSTSVDFYYRKNGGALSAKTTIVSTYVPTAAENYIHFSTSNVGSTTDFKIVLQSASFER